MRDARHPQPGRRRQGERTHECEARRPDGARLKKPSWKDPRLLVGILLVLASVVGVISLVGAADQTTEAYAAREPIAVGETLTADKLHRVKVRLGEVEQHYLTPESGLDAGLVAVQRIGKDQLLPRESLGQLDGLDRKPVAVTIEESPARPGRGGLPRGRLGGACRIPATASASPRCCSRRRNRPAHPGQHCPGSSRSTVVMVLVPDGQMPKLLGAQANKAKISVVWNPGGAVAMSIPW